MKYEQEVNIMKDLNTLNHRNIVRFIDSEIKEESLEGTRSYTIYLDHASCNLQEIISTKKQYEEKFSLKEVLQIYMQICRTLQMVLAKLKICHRDLKPANLLFDQKTYQILIGD